MLDKTVAAEYARFQEEEKQEKVRQHKREKRKAKKSAASAEKGTEQERQGVLEANGTDTRRGGKSYKKLQDVETATTDAEAGAEDDKQRLEKKMEVGLQELSINGPKHCPAEAVQIGKDKLDIKEVPKKNGVWGMQQSKKDSRIAEIKKPGWFFSGEDVLKDG